MDVFLDTCGRPRVKSLLLIYFFVLKAAADCPKPQGGLNSILTNEALLMNSFPEGTAATLECAKGYVTDSGSNVITCINGNWTQPDLICKKKDCGPPKPQPKMHFNITGGTLFGAVITAHCEKGYWLLGNGYKRCYATGWDGKAKCALVSCDPPAEVANGKVLWNSQDNPKYEDVVSYVCDDGFTLIGKESITCTESGDYDSQPPVCQEVSSSTYSPTRPTTHRDKIHTTSATPTAPSSTQGGRGILTLEDKTTAASVTSTTSFQDKAVDTIGDNGYIPLIISVTVVTLVVCVLLGFTYKFLLRRKGSYDTREDLKPELLQFQNL